MPDSFLWHTVIWIVRNKDDLVFQYVPNNERTSPALQAALWLKDQPLFRALLKESIRRAFTFPADVFDYCKRYVLDESRTLDGYLPWADPQFSTQPDELNGILDKPDVPSHIRANKQLRSIEVD
jgi:hypothetical protein